MIKLDAIIPCTARRLASVANHQDGPLLLLILLVAALNHLCTFLAYDWYAGIDSYSYDVAGFQIVTGLLLDPYPLMFRAPLVPIVKNVLYLLFEGHQALFCGVLHLLGVATTFFAWRLGRRFSRLVGAVAGMFMALSLPISVHFHHLSVTTIFIPLLLVTASQFVDWLHKPGKRASVLLSMLVFLCCMTRAEAVALIPIFALSGWLARVRKGQVAVFLGLSLFLYNAVCLVYYENLGYWGITKNTGWSLYVRMAFPEDSFFSEANGPASKQVQEYFNADIVLKIKGNKVDGDHNMIALDLAQRKMGFPAADQLFLQAGIEAMEKHFALFLQDSALRLLGQMDIYDPGLGHAEYPTETSSGHMWGFGEERMIWKQAMYADKRLDEEQMDSPSPLQWEREFLVAKFLRAFGGAVDVPDVPPEFQRSANIGRTPDGQFTELYTGDCMLLPRAWIIHAFDEYFFWHYWGQGSWSANMLRVLETWDKILPRGPLQKGLHSAMWVLWLMAIALSDDRKKRIPLVAFLAFVIFADLCQVVFSDNYGRRFFLFTVAFLWIGGSAGGELLGRWILNKKCMRESQ